MGAAVYAASSSPTPVAKKRKTSERVVKAT